METFKIEIQEFLSKIIEVDAADKEEVLTVTFHRNTEEAPEVTLKYFAYDDTYDSLEINGTERFLVKAEDVDALVKQIKKAF